MGGSWFQRIGATKSKSIKFGHNSPHPWDKGPTIYDVHMKGSEVRLRWTHADEVGGQLQVDVHTDN